MFFLHSIRATVFCLTMHFVFNCICAATVLRPQVFRLVPRQPLTQVVRLFFAVQLNSQLFSCCFLFHSPSFSSSSRIFRSCHFSLLLIFSYSHFSISIVRQCSFVYKLTFFPKNIIFKYFF